MLQLLTDLFARWRSDPAPAWAARSPRQRLEVAVLWLLQSRAQCEGSALRGIDLLPGENAGQKRRPCLIVHCQSANPLGADDVGSSADLYVCDLQIHLEMDYRRKSGADSMNQERAARILGEVSALLADVDLVSELVNDATLPQRPFSNFHLVRLVEIQTLGVPIGGGVQQDTIAYTAWLHTFDYPAL